MVMEIMLKSKLTTGSPSGEPGKIRNRERGGLMPALLDCLQEKGAQGKQYQGASALWHRSGFKRRDRSTHRFGFSRGNVKLGQTNSDNK